MVVCGSRAGPGGHGDKGGELERGAAESCLPREPGTSPLPDNAAQVWAGRRDGGDQALELEHACRGMQGCQSASQRSQSSDREGPLQYIVSVGVCGWVHSD